VIVTGGRPQQAVHAGGFEIFWNCFLHPEEKLENFGVCEPPECT